MNRTLWCQAFDVGLTWAGGPSPPGHHMSRDSDTCHLCVTIMHATLGAAVPRGKRV